MNEDPTAEVKKRKKVLTWSPDIHSEDRKEHAKIDQQGSRFSSTSIFDALNNVDGNDEEDIDNASEKSKKVNSEVNSDTKISINNPTSSKKNKTNIRNRSNNSAKLSTTTTSKESKVKDNFSLQGWIIFSILILMIIFSFSDFGLGDIYRGNNGINRILRVRGLFESAPFGPFGDSNSTYTSRNFATNFIKRFVHLNSKIFERPLGSMFADALDIEDMFDVDISNGAERFFLPQGELDLYINWPKENSIIDNKSARLSFSANGTALSALDPEKFEMKSGGALPNKRSLRIKAFIDDVEDSFFPDKAYEVTLEDSVHINMDLREHKILGADFGLGAHLVEVEMTLDPFPEHLSGDLVARPGHPQDTDRLLGSMIDTASVSFAYFSDEYMKQFVEEDDMQKLLLIEKSMKQVKEGEAAESAKTDTTAAESAEASQETASMYHLRLLGPNFEDSSFSLPHFTNGAVRLNLETSLATFVEEDQWSHLAVASYGTNTFLDLTMELKRKMVATPDISTVQHMPISMDGVFGDGKHTMVIRLIKIPSILIGIWSPDDLPNTKILAETSIDFVVQNSS